MNELQLVIERLKITKAPFSTLISGMPFDSDYFLVTSLADDIQYAIYKKRDVGFVIVDFFSNSSEANKEATEIINTYPRLAASINCQIEYHKQDIPEAKP
ncbi:Uncharacterised protein [Yersinia pseudotuberculosis]|uniref:hypothetical protein n=1 Tax=Yersinia pseudotuberculosis TaxID=633 RepID=UPI0005DAC535|nr:hypothetical protein [Yersinia pseudotuberculosis]BET62228.1 hypothetical protein YPSE1_16870 [Yersinia pseudotuberculosis]CNK59359.1 Uncharacterised protein [Yersinia pseudotuberculosis]